MSKAFSKLVKIFAAGMNDEIDIISDTYFKPVKFFFLLKNGGAAIMYNDSHILE